MIFSADMKVFGKQINLRLLNDTIGFVADTVKVDRSWRRELEQRCIFANRSTAHDEFQQKYGFLYLGEMLERYEERFGMSAQDRRAIALALAYTRDITTREMFVGNQRNAFLQEVRRHADTDIYLIGAMYLLNEGQSGETAWLERLNDFQYEKTEDLIFAMSLFPDFGQAFLQFKSQVIHLLGHGRTMPIQGNIYIWGWIIERLLPVVKTQRGGGLAVLRALCALPVSHVKKRASTTALCWSMAIRRLKSHTPIS